MSNLEAYKKQLLYYKALADKSIAQIEDSDIFNIPTQGYNSIAVTMKHMAGNMLSRWTDIIHTDGEKSWRNREDEFVDSFGDRNELITYWEEGWTRLIDTLNGLQDNDLQTIIYIRNMGCTVHDAIIRQIGHYAYHVGQIVYIARMSIGDQFESLSIPRGASQDYNSNQFSKEKEIKHFTDDK